MDLDRPILGDKESPDLLNRYSFARRIARILDLRKGSPGLVVSLEGRWGCGKTSLLNMVEVELTGAGNGNQAPIVFKFNPWLIGDRDLLIQAFLEEFAAHLNISSTGEKTKTAAKNLIKYAGWLRHLKYIPDPTGIGGAVANLGEAASNAANDLKLQDRPSLAQHRQMVKETLESLDVCVIVLMDDIDRLPPQEVFEVFRLAKAVADFPNTAYLLSYDQKYVVNALSQFIGGIDSHEFLEKIVQLRISVPELRTDQIHKLIVQEFIGISEAIPGVIQGTINHLQELLDAGLVAFFKNIRDIKRIFNRVRIDEVGCRGHVGLADLTALSAIAIKFPQLFAHIKEQPWLYALGVENQYERLDYNENNYEEAEKKRSAIYDQLASEFRGAVVSLINRLSPRTSKHPPGSGGNTELRAEGRIGLYEFLATALCSGIGDSEIELSKAQDYVKNPNSREEVLREVIEGKMHAAFCELVSAVCYRSPPTDRLQFCLSISRLLQDVENWQPIWNNQGNANSVAWATWKIVRSIVKKMEMGETHTFLDAFLAESESKFLKGQCVGALYRPEIKALADHFVVFEHYSSDMATSWCGEMRILCARVDFFPHFYSKFLFWLYSRIEPEQAKQVAIDIQPNDPRYDAFWKSVVDRSYASSGDMYVQFDISMLHYLGGLELHQENANRRRLEIKSLDFETECVLKAMISEKRVSLLDGNVSD